ncbi:MAG TPA: hypothetical protein VLA17_09555, partial [Candidatus Limnocylindria bacterium]|nr:hypothetical protein [Candidatus Limnocylindria bacterium]
FKFSTMSRGCLVAAGFKPALAVFTARRLRGFAPYGSMGCIVADALFNLQKGRLHVWNTWNH